MNLANLPLIFMGGAKIAGALNNFYSWHQRDIGTLLALLTLLTLLVGATLFNFFRIKHGLIEQQIRESSVHRSLRSASLLEAFISSKITLPLYLSILITYLVLGGALIVLFGSADIVVELQGLEMEPQGIGALSAWLIGPIGSGILTAVLALLTLFVIALTLILCMGAFFSASRRLRISTSTSLTTVDFILSLLETVLPARTMIEVAGDVRESITLLHNQGASPWEIRRQFAAGLLFILLDATRETLAFRRKKRG